MQVLANGRDHLPDPLVSAARWLRWLLRPTWSTLTLSSAATLWLATVRFREWTTGGEYQFTEHHYFWPSYTWSHGDLVVGPSSPALLANFVEGVLIWWLPAALCAGVLRAGVGRVVDREDLPAWLDAAVDFLALRPSRFLKTVGFAVVASFLPPLVVSLFTLPGIVVVRLIPVETFPALLPREYSPLYSYWAVPTAFVTWFVVLRVGGAGVRKVRAAARGDVVET